MKLILETYCCVKCGTPRTIARKGGQKREANHRKHMMCAKCKKRRALFLKNP